MSSERERTADLSTGPDPSTDPFETFSASQGQVEVIHGVYSHTMPLAGMSVDQVRTGCTWIPRQWPWSMGRR